MLLFKLLQVSWQDPKKSKHKTSSTASSSTASSGTAASQSSSSIKTSDTASKSSSSSNVSHATSVNEASVGDIQAQIELIEDEVLGVTAEECQAALASQHWSVENAIKYLKVEQLFRLGIAARSHCVELLEHCKWDLEAAGALLIDEFATGSAV